MAESIALITLLFSLSGISIIIFRKIPRLLTLPQDLPFQFNLNNLFLRLKILNPLKDFSFELFLQKVLSKIRILTLRTENKTANWLQRLRARSQEKKFNEDDTYWEEIKKSTKE